MTLTVIVLKVCKLKCFVKIMIAQHLGGKLSIGNIDTSLLWNGAFSVPFARPGSMYRGMPLHDQLMPLDGSLGKGMMASLTMDVKIREIKVSKQMY